LCRHLASEHFGIARGGENYRVTHEGRLKPTKLESANHRLPDFLPFARLPARFPPAFFFRTFRVASPDPFSSPSTCAIFMTTAIGTLSKCVGVFAIVRSP
jgi:hypothetical protein